MSNSLAIILLIATMTIISPVITTSIIKPSKTAQASTLQVQVQVNILLPNSSNSVVVNVTIDSNTGLPPRALWIVVIVILLLYICTLLLGAFCCDWCQCTGSVVFSPPAAEQAEEAAQDADNSIAGGSYRPPSRPYSLTARFSPRRTLTPQNCRLFSPLKGLFFKTAGRPQSQKQAVRKRSASLGRNKALKGSKGKVGGRKRTSSTLRASRRVSPSTATSSQRKMSLRQL